MYRKKEWDSGANRFQVVPSDDPIYPEGDFRADQPALDQPMPETRVPVPAQPNSAPAASAVLASQRTRRLGRRKVAIGAVAAVALGAAGWFGYDWWTVGRFTVATDDAYVQAYNNTVAAKVAGYIASVPVTDNTRVRAGDVIATLDDGDYRLAVNSARAKVATEQATIARIGHQITAQDAIVAQAKAQLASAQAGARRMELELDRQNLTDAARIDQPADGRAGAGEPRPGHRRRAKRTGRDRFGGGQCRRAQGPGAGGGRQPR